MRLIARHSVAASVLAEQVRLSRLLRLSVRSQQRYPHAILQGLLGSVAGSYCSNIARHSVSLMRPGRTHCMLALLASASVMQFSDVAAAALARIQPS